MLRDGPRPRAGARARAVVVFAWAAGLATSVTCARAASATATSAPTAPSSFHPLRIHIVCQRVGRTRACPAFLRGFVDATPVLMAAPESQAQVTLYVNVTARARFDRLALRFTSSLAGAPAAFEVLQEIDSRAPDDQQRAALEPAFLRGVAPFVAEVAPDAVAVKLVVPHGAAAAPIATSPWSFALSGSGDGTRAARYQSARIRGSLELARTTAASLLLVNAGLSYSLSRQPPLEIDGHKVSLDLDTYSLEATGEYALSLGRHLAVGALARAGHQDPGGSYRTTVRAHAGAAWDLYPSDDTRGNRLEIAYLIGLERDRYNRANGLGQRRAGFASHMLLASGSVRRDTVTWSLSASLAAQLLRPDRRRVISLSPEVSIQAGAHVDVESVAQPVAGGHAGPGRHRPGRLRPGDPGQLRRAAVDVGRGQPQAALGRDRPRPQQPLAVDQLDGGVRSAVTPA